MATLTTHLQLTKPDTTDNASPIPFNENMDKLDSEIYELKKEYVAAQGVQGNWTYRRWESGLAECWYTGTGNTGEWKWWSQKSDWLQFASNVIKIDYPLTFTGVPMEFASAICSSTDCWLDRSGAPTVQRSSSYYLTTQGDTRKTAGTYTFNLYVVGRWK